MTETSTTPAPEMGVLTRFVGIITSPTSTYEVVVRSPKPAIMLLLVSALIAIGASIPQFTEKGRQAVLDMQVQTVERMTGQQMNDEMYRAMEERSRYNGISTLIWTFVFTPIMALFFAGLYWGVFNAVMGGTASFKQVLGVVTHSMAIMAVAALAAAPVQLMSSSFSMTGPFNLGALVPMLDQESFLVRFLSGINIFTIWQVIVIAIGLGVLYRRKPGTIATVLLVLYGVMVAVGVTIFSAFMGR